MITRDVFKWPKYKKAKAFVTPTQVPICPTCFGITIVTEAYQQNTDSTQFLYQLYCTECGLNFLGREGLVIVCTLAALNAQADEYNS